MEKAWETRGRRCGPMKGCLRLEFGDVYDGVLADDERVVAFRYKVSKYLRGWINGSGCADGMERPVQ